MYSCNGGLWDMCQSPNMFTCTYTHTGTHIQISCISTFILRYTHIYICVHTYTYIPTYRHISTHTEYTHTHMNAHTHIQWDIHTHVHTHVYTHAPPTHTLIYTHTHINRNTHTFYFLHFEGVVSCSRNALPDGRCKVTIESITFDFRSSQLSRAQHPAQWPTQCQHRHLHRPISNKTCSLRSSPSFWEILLKFPFVAPPLSRKAGAELTGRCYCVSKEKNVNPFFFSISYWSSHFKNNWSQKKINNWSHGGYIYPYS